MATDEQNAANRVYWMTRRRPFVSAKNPHKWNDSIIPSEFTEPKNPFCEDVKFKSHCDTGNIYVMLYFSDTVAIMIKPLKKINV